MSKDANRPKGAQQSSPGQSEAAQPRSVAPGRWSPKPASPNRGATRANAVAFATMLASCEIFIEALVPKRERARTSFCGAPIGAWELFLRLPRAARCRRGRRHRSALGSIVSARWAARVARSVVQHEKGSRPVSGGVTLLQVRVCTWSIKGAYTHLHSRSWGEGVAVWDLSVG